jgi:cell division protein FtsA
MMSEGRAVIGIDLGSAGVKVVVGVIEDERLQVLGCGQARHDGARKGIIANLHEVSNAVRVAAEEAEAMASIPIEEAAVGLGGTPIQGMRSMASAPVTGRHQTVTEEDQRRALGACAQVSIPADFRVLEIIGCGFALDGQDGLEHPQGMPGSRLDATAYVLFTHRTHAETVEQAVNHASVAVRDLHYEPLAAAEAVLTDDERQLGCLLIDIGHATSEWLLTCDGSVLASGAIGIGGRHFTSDLAAVLRTTTVAAERVKGSTTIGVDRDSLDGQAIEVPALGGEGHLVHPAEFASEILYERARDLLIGIHRVLVDDNLERVPRAGVVLTGGGALLDGIEEVADTILGTRVRVGTPLALSGVVEPVSGPEWAVACGLIWLRHRRQTRCLEASPGSGGFFSWLRNALGEFFELGGGA